MFGAKITAIAREKFINHMMPDRCQLFPAVSSTPTISASGYLTQSTPTPRLWRSTSTIPCRIFVSRSFRGERAEYTNVVVSEFYIEFPFDAPVSDGDTVVIADGGTFKIRKISPHGDWRTTIECQVEEVQNAFDFNKIRP
jgi:hypothetical protein